MGKVRTHNYQTKGAGNCMCLAVVVINLCGKDV